VGPRAGLEGGKSRPHGDLIPDQKINSVDDKTRPILLPEYSEINKRVRKYARCDKRAWADKLAHKTQLAAEINNSREL
jgi:hypothetical protein